MLIYFIIETIHSERKGHYFPCQFLTSLLKKFGTGLIICVPIRARASNPGMPSPFPHPPPPSSSLTTHTLFSLLPSSPPESGSPSQHLSEWNKLLPCSSFFQASLGDTTSSCRNNLVMGTALGSPAQSVGESGNTVAHSCSSYLFTASE